MGERKETHQPLRSGIVVNRAPVRRLRRGSDPPRRDLAELTRAPGTTGSERPAVQANAVARLMQIHGFEADIEEFVV
jgi:hypothetical protein